MNENIKNIESVEEENGIDFGAIWLAIKKQWKIYAIVVPTFMVLGVAYSLNKVNYYTSKVMLAPEANASSGTGGGLASLARRFGVGASRSANNGQDVDAIVPDLYPDLINSVDFKTKLFTIDTEKTICHTITIC